MKTMLLIGWLTVLSIANLVIGKAVSEVLPGIGVMTATFFILQNIGLAASKYFLKPLF